jgi:uncharacterized protein (TIGR02611 family)
MADRKSVVRFTQRHGRRAAVTVAGILVLLAGVILSLPLVPGPGILVMVAGLAILATEYEWARRLLVKVKRTTRRTIDMAKGRMRPGASADDPDDDRDAAA